MMIPAKTLSGMKFPSMAMRALSMAPTAIDYYNYNGFLDFFDTVSMFDTTKSYNMSTEYI